MWLPHQGLVTKHIRPKWPERLRVRAIAQRTLPPLVQVLLSAYLSFMAYRLIRPIHMVKHDSRWCNLHIFFSGFGVVILVGLAMYRERNSQWALLRFDLATKAMPDDAETSEVWTFTWNFHLDLLEPAWKTQQSSLGNSHISLKFKWQLQSTRKVDKKSLRLTEAG